MFCNNDILLQCPAQSGVWKFVHIAWVEYFVAPSYIILLQHTHLFTVHFVPNKT
jgi:hypothetical protein